MGRMTSSEEPADATEPGVERPSKSARKRAATSLQDLGVELAGWPDAELDGLGLPDELAAAIRELRRLRAHGARLRQRQYIGKLMRRIDPEPVIARIDARKREHDRQVRAFQQIERWRDRLIGPEAAAVDDFLAAHPAADRASLLRLVEAARAERAAGRPPAAARELFAQLKQWIR
jgi:ribosome-associated protein